MLKGFDISFGSGLTVAQAKGLGYQFVCRYLSGGNPKDINRAELDNWVAGGVPVIFVWETDGQMAGASQGASHAHAAQAELNTIGAGSAIVHFAQDIPVNVSMADQLAYLHAASSVLGHDRMGGYGDYDSIHAWFDAGVIKYGWQTYGGSNGQWDDRALIRQVLNGIMVGPAQADLDNAAYWNSTKVLGLSDDFGQWPRPKSTPPPTGPFRHVIPAGNKYSFSGWAEYLRHEAPDALLAYNKSLVPGTLSQNHYNLLAALLAADNAAGTGGAERPAMGANTIIYTKNA